MNLGRFSLLLPNADHTRSAGASLGIALLNANVDQPLIVHLDGELGAGKTTFVGGMLNAIGYAGVVRSPTYTLIEPYEFHRGDTKSALQVMHMDLYRLTDASQLEELGVRDMVIPGNVLLIEWPERAGDFLPQPDLVIALAYPADGLTGRKLDLTANSESAQQLLHQAYSHTLPAHER